MTVPELDDGTVTSLVRPTTPVRRYESPRRVRFRRVKEEKSNLVLLADSRRGKAMVKQRKNTRRVLGGIKIGSFIAEKWESLVLFSGFGGLKKFKIEKDSTSSVQFSSFLGD